MFTAIQGCLTLVMLLLTVQERFNLFCMNFAPMLFFLRHYYQICIQMSKHDPRIGPEVL